MRGPRELFRVVVAGALLLSAAAACGTDDPAKPSATTTTVPLSVVGPVPFELTALPDGYAVDRALDGSSEVTWTSDSFGGAHPAVVVVPDDWAGIDDRRWISVLAIDGSGNEGGFAQELPSYIRDGGEQTASIDGHPAIVASGSAGREGESGIPPFVAINTSTTGDDIEGGERTGLLVLGPSATVDELRAVADRASYVEPHTPTLPTAPDGWRVLGTTTGPQVSVAQFGSDDAALVTGQRMLAATDATHNDSSAVRVSSIEGMADTPLLLAIDAAWYRYSIDDVAEVTPLTVGAAVGFVRAGRYSTTAWFTLDGSPFVADIPKVVIDAGFTIEALVDGVRVTDDDRWSALRAAMRNDLGQPVGSIALSTGSDDIGTWTVTLLPGSSPMPPTTVFGAPPTVDLGQYFQARRVEVAVERPGAAIARLGMLSSSSTTGMAPLDSYYLTSTSSGEPGFSLDSFVFVATPGPATSAEFDIGGQKVTVPLDAVGELPGVRCGSAHFRFAEEGLRNGTMTLVAPDGSRSGAQMVFVS